MAIESASLLGLDRTNLRQQALTALRRAITAGELPPGTHLVETELSEMLQISRGTLREALRELQQQGLVSAGPRGRLSVRSLEPREIQDIFTVRAALESLAARLLSNRDDRGDAVDTLRRAMEEMARAEKRGLEEQIEADLEFHRTLCLLTGNQTLLQSWQSLEGSIRMSIMFAGIGRAVRNMGIDRHAEIVDAIESGDADRARITIIAHMDDAAANLVAAEV